ncbi:hypothetical protein HYH03_006586 [Edaphochlamys debaryana]|uniref:Peptidase S54 rhomboid domain-containing protein n=1 Tax=Edaphochlamys debaryana TaxID=47281 RepID=A0A835Y550_9CHLO|nr:hypothetical protein HYH03_006586 [Edaphochlamys debaryana]|eukprot:KAG2495314.1 hypothetical protein HYH03_006586 [Edaphochlamys debaryana]
MPSEPSISGITATISGAASSLADAARDAWRGAEDAVGRIAAETGLTAPTSARDPDGLVGRVRRPLERHAAALRWSRFGPATLVPLPPPSAEDPRLLLSAASLVQSVLTEMAEHRRQCEGGSSAGGGMDGLPLPPVTLALVGAAVWRYLHPVALRDVCLSPYCVMEQTPRADGIVRLWSSTLVHMDVVHLLANLSALLPDAAALERAGGSGAFAADTALLAGLSSGVFVAWAVFAKEVLRRSDPYYAVGAVGLSSLAFAMQVVHGESRRGQRVLLLGCLPLPAPYSWVPGVVLSHVLAPESSFAGHMAGVAAGVLHSYIVRPVLRSVLRLLRGGGGGGAGGAAPRPRFYGSGTTSGRPVQGSGGGGGGGGGALRSALKGLAAQVLLMAAVVGAATLASRRGGQRSVPITRWRMR